MLGAEQREPAGYNADHSLDAGCAQLREPVIDIADHALPKEKLRYCGICCCSQLVVVVVNERFRKKRNTLRKICRKVFTLLIVYLMRRWIARSSGSQRSYIAGHSLDAALGCGEQREPADLRCRSFIGCRKILQCLCY